FVFNNLTIENKRQAQQAITEIELYDIENQDYAISDEFKKALINEDFKNHIQQLIDFGVDRYKDMYMGVKLDNNPFALYEKYNYEQVCQLLEWPKNQIAQNIGGYKFDEATKTYPVFINYHKGDDVQDSIKYEDRFESQTLIKAISKNNRYLRSKDVNTAINADSLGVSMHLFVRKNKDDKESKEFYYLGPIHSTGKENAREIIRNGNTPAVEIEYRLDIPVRDDIYDYIING
ncbi:MAG: DUF3427 domain-containing protein, partial [Veillonella sp.]|nr:DUF3427 domain-containing protein [Veillonella sp.]